MSGLMRRTLPSSARRPPPAASASGAARAVKLASNSSPPPRGPGPPRWISPTTVAAARRRSRFPGRGRKGERARLAHSLKTVQAGLLAACTGLGIHEGAQNGVNARLVAAAVLLKPFHKIVVKPDCHAVFRCGHGELGGPPEGFVQLGNIGVIDIPIAHLPQALKVSLALRPREMRDRDIAHLPQALKVSLALRPRL